MPYPVASDLGSFLSSAGLTTASLDLASAIAAAVDWWEDYTHWYPFLAGVVEGKTRFDPPHGSYLDLGSSNGPGGYVSISLVETDLSGAAASGAAKTLWVDYVLHYWRNRTTIVGIEFTSWLGGDLRSVQVTGIPGFSSTLPDDVFQAILRYAASLLQPLLAILATATDSQSFGIIEWREGDVTERYGDNPLGAQGQLWATQAQMTAERYRRMRMA